MTALVHRTTATTQIASLGGPKSLNGWPGITSESDRRMTRVTVPGTHKAILVRKEVAPAFLSLLSRINKEVLPLNPGPLDSWEYRDARLGGGLSNHASGTAIDFRYDVLPADHQVHMTSAQRRQMERILDAYKTPDGHRLFGWGGEWTPGRACDEMHIEVGQDWQVGRAITPGDFTRFTQSHHLRPDGTVGGTTPATPTTPSTPPPPASPKRPIVHLHDLQPGDVNGEVRLLQKALVAHGFNPGPIDGQFGPKTQAAVRALQLSLGFRGYDADGIPGRQSLGFLGFDVRL